MAQNTSCHSRFHTRATMLALPDKNMTDIWNKFIVWSFTNCDISQTIDKTLFGLLPLT